MLWAIGSRNLSSHLTEAAITQEYQDTGNVSILTAAQRWALDQRVVKQLIATSVPDTVFNDIKGTAASTAKDVWDDLRRLFEGRTTLILVDLGRRLQTTRCAEEESVCEHFEKLATMREQLAAMGKSVPDTEFASILMGSLPPSYASTLSGIAAAAEISNTTPTVSSVRKLAVDEYDRRTLNNGKAQDEAFAVDAKKKGKKRDIECFNCHKRGHMKSDCWARGGGKEGQAPKRRGGSKNDSAAGAEQSSGKSSGKSEDVEAWAAIVDVEEDEGAISGVPAMAADERGDVEAELYDLGASRHMSPFRERFITYNEIPPCPITAANNHVFYAVGTGDLQIDVPNGKNTQQVVLKDTLHAPDMGLTVVSIGRIVDAGCTVQFEDKSCKIRRGTKVIGSIPARANGLYKVDHTYSADASPEQVDILTLHRRLGHISPDAIRTLIRTNTVSGLRLVDNLPSFICDSCEYAKATRKVIRKEREAPIADSFGAEIHSDLWGPSPLLSLGGRKFYVTFTDDHSRYTRLELLRTKDETLEAYKGYAAWAKTQHAVHIKRLRSDRGGEYTGHEFTDFLREQGTERRLTTADTPQHNGIAESLNRRLLERVRALLHQADLPKNLWAEAIKFAVWLKNRTSTKTLGNVTPYERLYGQKPNLSGVPEWGQSVWVRKPASSKLDARATQARWVGFDADSTHAHRIYWPNTKRISIERDIKFVPPSVIVHSSPPSYEPAAVPPPASQPPPPPAQPPAQQAPPPQQPQSPQQPPASGPSTSVLPPTVPPLPATPQQAQRETQVPGAPRKPPTLGKQLSQIGITPRRTTRQPQPSDKVQETSGRRGYDWRRT
jgi:transposase InsO family protein